MKFGFESEKLLFDLKTDSINHGVFEFVSALSDYGIFHGDEVTSRVSNEFVLNMIEMNTIASPLQRAVIEDYLLLHQLVCDVAARDKVVPLPLAAVPFDFTPNMVPKWAYYVQNSILSGRRLESWNLTPKSPLTSAGNCAGLHAHFEIECLPEFLVFSDELVNKHNLALMLTPMTAFSASPYFYGEHGAYSMRAHKYYYGVYEHFPRNGGLPPVMRTSEEVLRYTLSGLEDWIEAGVKIGFSRDDLNKLSSRKGANWSMLRWNRTWNTIELRCLESDRVDYDISKFTWVAGAMKRTDLRGEGLVPQALATEAELDEKMIDEALKVSGRHVSILPTHAIHELTNRAIHAGIQDPLVERYLHRLGAFAEPGVDHDCLHVFEILRKALQEKRTTAEVMLKSLNHARHVSRKQCIQVIRDLLQQDALRLQTLRTDFAGVIRKRKSELFPHQTREAG